jgi:ATP-dependent Lon protease
MKAPLRSGISRKPASVSAGPAKAAAPAGVVLGLALTRTGATAATVECLPLQGRGKIILTGNLVGSARDAAHVAVSLARARAKSLGLDPALFLHTDLHFHVMDPLPQKGGPSIGLPMFVALVSALTRKPVDPRIAFTGELSLTGKVHAVEGIAAKAKAAAKAGVTRLFAPAENVAEMKGKKAAKSLGLVGVEDIGEVLKTAWGKTAGTPPAGHEPEA